MERSYHVEAGSLEALLLQMINDHNHAAIELQERTGLPENEERSYSDCNSCFGSACEAVNGGVHEIFMNEKRIEAEIRPLTATIMRFSKQTDQWLTASHAVNTAVKEIGDFKNWMKTMELDCKSISAAICNIHQT